MIRYSLSLLLLVLAALIAQQFIPALAGLYNARLLVLPLFFLCASVTVGPPMMLLLAFVCGFLWDTQNAITTHVGDPEVYIKPAEAMRFGYSIILYAAVGYIMQGIRPLFREGKWQFSTFLTGVSVFVYQLADYLLINFVRGGFHFNRPTFLQIFFTSLLTMLFAPLVFWLLSRLADACSYSLWSAAPKPGSGGGRRRIYP